MNEELEDAIKAEAQKVVRNFCSHLFDASNGSQETFERYVRIFSRSVSIEINKLVPELRASNALDLFKQKDKIEEILE